MIEFYALNRMCDPLQGSLPLSTEKLLSSFLLRNLNELSADLYQKPEHISLYQKIKDLKNEPLNAYVKKIELCAAILNFSKGDFDQNKTDHIFKIWDQLRTAKQLTPEMDKLLSYLLARALKLDDAKGRVGLVRDIINRNFSNDQQKGMAFAAWINCNNLKLDHTNLNGAELTLAAPYLHYVNCLGLDVDDPLEFILSCSNAYQVMIYSKGITELSELPPLVEELEVRCPELTTLSLRSAPHLRTLDCTTCEALTTLSLSDVPQLKNLNCTGCKGIRTLTLPDTPQLEKLHMQGCLSLRSLTLSDASHLNHLNGNNCISLTALTLPSTPLLVELECNNTPITELSLPHAPQLKYLKCLDCPALTRIVFPNALQLATLDCSRCPVLTILSIVRAPKLENLQCEGCFRLTTIEAEAFPNCWQINCADCQIESFPQLPPNATVYGNRGFYSFRVNPLELAQFPRKVLLDLGKHLLANQPMPNIVWLNPLTNRPADGIDAGGLRRQFITTLCDNLFTEGSLFPFTGELGGKLPLLERGEEVLPLRTFARLIALCSTSTLLLGEHLPHSFFYAVRSCLDQEMDEKKVYLTLLGLWDSEFTAEENYTQHREELENPLPVTLPILIVANELKTIPRYSLDQLRHEPLRFIESVKGTAVTKEALLAKMQFEGMREYFERFMEEHPHKLTDLVELFTSCRTLGEQPITIKVFARDQGQLPLIHTCSQEVEMPLYSSYEIFREKLNMAFSALKTFENA